MFLKTSHPIIAAAVIMDFYENPCCDIDSHHFMYYHIIRTLKVIIIFNQSKIILLFYLTVTVKNTGQANNVAGFKGFLCTAEITGQQRVGKFTSEDISFKQTCPGVSLF